MCLSGLPSLPLGRGAFVSQRRCAPLVALGPRFFQDEVPSVGSGARLTLHVSPAAVAARSVLSWSVPRQAPPGASARPDCWWGGGVRPFTVAPPKDPCAPHSQRQELTGTCISISLKFTSGLGDGISMAGWLGADCPELLLLLWVTSIHIFLVEPLLKPFSHPTTR